MNKITYLILIILLNGFINIACADVNSTSGKYFANVEDLKIKIIGGHLAIERTWVDGVWHFNRRWNRLRVIRNLADNTISEIERNDNVYEKVNQQDSVFKFGRSDVISVISDGYQWQDKKGNWIKYNLEGFIQSYGNSNSLVASITYDAQQRINAVFDVLNKQVLWLSYNDQNKPIEIRDYTQRKVTYSYSADKLTSVVDVRLKQWLYEYSANHLVRKIDPEGNFIALTYNPFNKLIKEEDGIGVIRSFGYDFDSVKKEYYFRETNSAGIINESWYSNTGELIRSSINGNSSETIKMDTNASATTDHNGYETQYQYDEWGNQLKVIYPDGSSETREYESVNSNLIKYVNGNGVVNVYQYDERGNLIAKTEAKDTAVERITEYEYDLYGNRTKQTLLADTIPEQVSILFKYDDFGNLIEVTDGEGNTEILSYDVMGNLLERLDKRGHKWVNTYDEMGHKLSTLNPLNIGFHFEYDGAGNQVKEIAANLNNTTFVYDARNRLVSKTAVVNKPVLYGYDASNRLNKITDEEGVVIAYEYDSLGRFSKQTIAGIVNVEFKYANVSDFLPSQAIYPDYSQSLKYDRRYRLVTQITELAGGDSQVYRYNYDAVGNLLSEANRLGYSVYFEYDELSRIVKKRDEAGKDALLTYDKRDNILSILNANLHLSRFQYDKNNNLIKLIRPLGQTVTNTVDAEGNVVEKIDALNHKTAYQYDIAGRLIKKSNFTQVEDTVASRVVDFSYNELDKLSAYNDGISSASYEYDNLGRKLKETINYGLFSKSFSYSYYANGLKKSFIGADLIAYQYGRQNKYFLSSIEASGLGEMGYSYQNFKVKELSIPGGSKTVYAFDPIGQVNHIKSFKNNGIDLLMDLAFVFDKEGKLTQKTSLAGNFSFQYDALGQLETVDYPVLTDQIFTYDAVGNKLSDNLVPGAYQYNENSYLLTAGGESFSYDDNGNTLQRDDGNGKITQYVYDLDNRLVQVSSNLNGTLGEYYYDPFGRRLWKQTSSSKIYYMYADEGLVAEFDNNGGQIRSYGFSPDGKWMTNPLFLKQGDNFYFYRNDQIGTPQLITDINDNIVWSANYQAFGTANIQSETIVNPLRFAGQYFDSESALSYNWQRYYDQSLGRYLRVDPVGFKKGRSFPYIYAENDPINGIDPLGLCKWKGAVANISVGEVVYGASASIMRLTSECCSKQKARGTYAVLAGGLAVGATPVSATISEAELDGPDKPAKTHPEGVFAIAGASVVVGFGGGWSAMTTGSLSGKGFARAVGFDISVFSLVGATVMSNGEESCCQ